MGDGVDARQLRVRARGVHEPRAACPGISSTSTSSTSSPSTTEPRLYLNAFSLCYAAPADLQPHAGDPRRLQRCPVHVHALPARRHGSRSAHHGRHPRSHGTAGHLEQGERNNLSAVLALDPLTHCFWRQPTDAYDAFQLMLMNPIVALQQFVYAVYAQTDYLVNGRPANPPPAIGSRWIPNARSRSHACSAFPSRSCQGGGADAS